MLNRNFESHQEVMLYQIAHALKKEYNRDVEGLNNVIKRKQELLDDNENIENGLQHMQKLADEERDIFTKQLILKQINMVRIRYIDGILDKLEKEITYYQVSIPEKLDRYDKFIKDNNLNDQNKLIVCNGYILYEV